MPTNVTYGPTVVATPTPATTDANALAFDTTALNVYDAQSGGTQLTALTAFGAGSVVSGQIVPDPATGAVGYQRSDGVVAVTWVEDPATGVRYPVLPNELSGLVGGVKTVNGEVPDSAGNLALTAPDVGGTGTDPVSMFLNATNVADAQAAIETIDIMDLSDGIAKAEQYTDTKVAALLTAFGRPQPVQNLVVTTTTASALTLSWDALTVTPTGYKLYRGATQAADLTGGTLATTYTDSGLAADTTFTYTVVPYNANGASIASDPVEGHTLATGSDKPTAPVLSPNGATSTSISLAWTASTAPSGDPVQGYKVYKDGSGTALTTLGPTVFTYTDSGLTTNSSHTYVATAYNTAGEGPASNSVSSTAADNTAPVRGAFSSTPDAVNTSTKSATLPTGIFDGDAGYIIVNSNVGTNTIATLPTGWTQADTQVGGTNNKAAWLLTKRMVAADSGAAVTVTMSAGSRLTLGGIVMGRSLQSANASVPWADDSDDAVVGLPAITPTASDTSEVALVAARYGNLGSNGFASWPTGYTEQVDTVSTHTTTPLMGIGIATKPLPGAAATQAAANGAYVNTGQELGWLLAVAPNLNLPTAPTLTNPSKTDTTVDLSWSGATAPTGHAITGYYVYRSGVQIADVTSGTTYTDTGLTASTAYPYQVRAHNTDGTGTGSSTLTVTTNPASGSGRFPGDPGSGNIYLGATEGIESITAFDQDLYGSTPTKRHKLVRLYNGSNLLVSSGDQSTLTAHCKAGRIPLYSFKNGAYSNAQIAAGSADSDLDTLGTFYAGLPGPIWLCFWHEPEDNNTTTAAQQSYRAAFRYIVNYLYTNYAGTRTKVAWTTILQGFRFTASQTAFRNWHPNWNNAGTAWLTTGPFGGSYVHMDGVDRYNPSGPKNYGTFDATTRMTTWAANMGDYFSAFSLGASGTDPGNTSQQRPHVIGEYGTYSTPTTIDDTVSSAAIFNSMVSTGASTNNVVGVTHFNAQQCAMNTTYDPGRVRRTAWKNAIDSHSNVIMIAGG